MKIAFIFLWRIGSEDGVTKKIRGQIRVWRELGHEVEAICLSDEPGNKSDADFVVVDRCTPMGLLSRPLVDRRATREVCEMLRQFGPDVVYMRQTGNLRLMAPIAEAHRTVFELNSNDLTELELRYRARRSPRTWLHYVRLKRNHPKIYGSLSGVVGVTRELAEAETYRGYGLKTTVVPNGIELGRVEPLAAPGGGERLPRIAFACGTYHAPWHGFDEVVALAAATVGQLEVHVVGGELGGRDDLPSNLIAHGYLETEAYREVLGSCDVGLGSCGLHRIPLQEACPLKTRDYLASGLPVIVPYADTALEEAKARDGRYPEWVLKVPNESGNLVAEKAGIVEFCRRWAGRRVARAEVEPLIDFFVLERRRLGFFEEICQEEEARVR